MTISRESTTSRDSNPPPARRKGRIPRPTGPSGLSLLRAFTSRDPSRPVMWFEQTARAYPRICHVWGPGRHTYVISEASLVTQLLQTHGRHLRKGVIFDVIKALFGEGLITSEGALHRRQRRLVQPAFHHARITEHAAAMVDATWEHQQHWRDGETVDMAEQMLGLTLTIVGRTLFGSDLRGDVPVMGRALQTALSGLRTIGYLPMGTQLLRLPLPASRRIRAAVADIDAAVRRVITERRDAPETGDLLSMLLLAEDEHGRMTEQQVHDEVVTIMIAGHETTAMALTWTWHLLSTHPEVADRVYHELQTVLGDRVATAADYPLLPLTRAVVAEALRLYPPGWGFPRTTTGDITLDGWLIPAGSVCAVSQWVMHRDPRYWQEPLRFLPDRWLDPAGNFSESQPGQPRGAWFPFGMGNRICIGEHFAWMEAVLAMATLFRRWRVTAVPDHPVAVEGDLTLRTAHGMRLTLHRR